MYGFDGAAYDRWLTTDPREMSAGEEDAYVNWCEENDLDPYDDHWEAFNEYQQDLADDYAAEVAEAAAEDRMLDAYDNY